MMAIQRRLMITFVRRHAIRWLCPPQHISRTFKEYPDGRFLESPGNMVNVRLDWNIPMEASYNKI